MFHLFRSIPELMKHIVVNELAVQVQLLGPFVSKPRSIFVVDCNVEHLEAFPILYNHIVSDIQASNFSLWARI